MYSLVNANTQVGNFNLLCTYSSISVNCAIGNHNVLSPYSSISKNVCIENSNLLESGEILFEDLESDCILTNGVVYAND
jgi:acyl-[acyl carrier protein]--UDP-N-acetylglucosamine O-acyltransferase